MTVTPTSPIRVYHTGRIAHESYPRPVFPVGMLWSRDMRFFFTHVPVGRYTLELQMKETTRPDITVSNAVQPAVDIFINMRRVLAGARVCAEREEDPYTVIPVPVTVTGQGLDVRIYGVTGSHAQPCLYGMRLLQGEDVVYQFTVGDARERAMWQPSPVDMQTGTTTCTAYEALLHSGLPLGGIGTGRLELFTNGTLGSFSTNNNWDVPIYWTEGSFFALWTSTDGAVMLHPPRTAGGYGLPTAQAVHFHGRYPVADLGYDLGASPVEVTLRAQGTMTPGDEAQSLLPAAMFTFTVRNTGEAPVEAAVLMSLDNLCGQGGYMYLQADHSEYLKQRFDATDGAVQRAWQAGEQTGVHFANTRTPQSLPERNTFTEFLLTAEGAGVSRCLAWDVEATEPGFWRQFNTDGTLVAAERVTPQRPAGALARKVALAPGESQDITFTLAWYHAGHLTHRDGVDHGHAYQQAYPNITAVMRAAATTRGTCGAALNDWQRLIIESTLPGWLQTKLLNGAFPTTTNSIWTNDGLFTIHESPVDMLGAVGTLDQRMASHPFTFTFFPELDRLELDWFRRLQQPDGQLPHMIGNVYDQLGSTETFYCVTGWPDLSCSFIFQTYRHFLYTGDREYLRTNFTAYERAIAWMQSTDATGLGLPVGGCTYDYEHHTWRDGPPMVFNAINYLGALRTAIAAATRLGREDCIKAWNTAFDKAYESLMTHFWNGRYFRKWVHPESGAQSDNCFVSQLAGDWFVRLLGLEPLFPDAITDSTLNSIVELHMLPHYPSVLMEAHPDGEMYTPYGYIQQHEPYLGMELIYRGQVGRGLEVLRRRAEITWQVNGNPWGESLSTQMPSGREGNLFDYMTSTAAWNVLYALAGVTIDAERGVLRLTPQLDGARTMRLPIFLQDLWLWLDIDLDRAPVAKLSIVRRGPNAVIPTKMACSLPGNSVAAILLSS